MAAPAAAAGAGAAKGAAKGLALPKGLKAKLGKQLGRKAIDQAQDGGLEGIVKILIGLLGLLVSLLLIVLLPIALVLMIASFFPFPGSPPAGIPAVYWPMYTAAASYYKVNPYLLASIHKQESSFSRNPAVRSGANGSGAEGPMEFLNTTWPGYQKAFYPIRSERPDHYPLDRRQLASCRGVPADVGCVYDDFDSIAAAAKLLHESGATTSLYSSGTHKAVCGYIGSCLEVDHCTHSENEYCEVLPRAQRWELEGASLSGGGPVRERIVALADSQLAAHVHERAGNCNPYGPCAEWCAMFSTWVWEHGAGIHIRAAMSSQGYSPFWVPDLETYAKRHGLWHSAPEPGDMIIWDAHVGLVERVLGGGRISEIGGNQSDAVTRLVGPPSGLGEGTPNGYMSPPAGSSKT